MFLPPVLAVHVHDVTTVVVLLVALIALALAVVGYRAQKRAANRNLWFVTAAFALFAVKGAFTTWGVATGAVKHEHLEFVISLMDLLILSLLAYPLVRGRASKRRT